MVADSPTALPLTFLIAIHSTSSQNAETTLPAQPVEHLYLEFVGVHDVSPQLHVVLVTGPLGADTHLDDLPAPLYRNNSSSITLDEKRGIEGAVTWLQ